MVGCAAIKPALKKYVIVEYDYVGAVTKQNADELIEFVHELKKDVLDWLKKQHSDLI